MKTLDFFKKNSISYVKRKSMILILPFLVSFSIPFLHKYSWIAIDNKFLLCNTNKNCKTANIFCAVRDGCYPAEYSANPILNVKE